MPDDAPQFAGDLTAEQQVLWRKLAAFSFDAQSVARPFSARLAAEHGWTAEFAARALDEYRRFLFLTSAAGHVVCPSEQVDAVWHQHLTYSRSYWNDLCRQTLGGPLHHDPTAGGPAESRKHWAMYRQTLASYRRIFGVEPPRDLWPLPCERFDPRSQPRTLDAAEHWIVRKPGWWPRGSRRRRGLAAVLFPIPLAAAWLGPLDWSGPEFLGLFFGLYAVLLIGAFVFRRMQRDVPVKDDRDLTVEEIACLAFGRPAAVNAVVAGMLHEVQLVSVPSKGIFGKTNGAKVKFARGAGRPPNGQTLAAAIYRAVEIREKTLKEVQAAVTSETEAIDRQLESTGYLLEKSQTWAARLIPAAAMLGLLALGLAKIWIGVQRGRPIGFLAVGCFVVVVTCLAMLASIRRSLAGDRLVETLKSQHADLKSTAESNAWGAEQVILCAALFGATALDGSIFADLKSAWQTSSGGGSGCGGGGCGGGCGGCGGGN